jgi:hypothetical protein
MTKSYDFGTLLKKTPRYITPEKLTKLKHVFDTVCKNAGIFDEASQERDALATQLLLMAETIENDSLLIAVGHEAVAKLRR